jgi:hypothetical protein
MLACFFTKLSLGLGHLRILKFQHLDSRWERLLCYAVIVFSCVVNLLSFFAIVFACAEDGIMPLNSASAIAMGKCSILTYRNLVITYLQSAANVVVDLLFVLLPIPSIIKTIMDRRTRIAIIGILFLGARYSLSFLS